MVIYQGHSHRLPSGAKFTPHMKKVKRRFGSNPIDTHIGPSRKKFVRARGGGIKVKAYAQDKINVLDPKTKKAKIATIKNLEKNAASVDLTRRSILTKGAIVITDLGRVQITSRPGQVGHLDGILLEK
jgi:small subunit ribosomal protein S8e